MATAYTPILKLALPVTGELNGTWGDVVNQNITEMVEQAVAGLATINTWTTNSHTLTTANGTTSESRCAMLVADDDGAGNPSAAATIICPAASKLYILKNISGQTVTLKTSAGTGIAVPNNQTSFLFCDGTNVEACVTSIVDGNVSGNLTVQGNATVNGNTTLGNATSDTVTLTARVASVVSPSADNTYDLGSTANSWKDLYIDGTAYLALVDINGGTIDNVTIGGSTPAAGSFTNLAYTGTLTGGTGVINIGSGQVYKDASGNVGIGTASPSQRLTVIGNLRAVGTSNTVSLELAGASSATDGAYSIKTQATRSLTFTDDYQGLERMRINSTGNVGIGTTNPASWKLEVHKSDANLLNLFNTTGLGVQLQMADQGFSGGINMNNGNLLLQSGGLVERARIDYSGNLLVGKTSTDDSVQGTNINNNGSIEFTTANSGTQYPVTFYRAGSASAVGFISTDASNTTTYSTTSDYRLKENVAPMTGALAKVAALKPCVYTWKSTGETGQGFIAHELQAIVPECVTGQKDAVDENGNPKYQGIDTSFLVATLTAAIQEQQTLIQSLTSRLEALENK